jgi:UDP-N-acetylmuramyl pentapeptide synthase
MRSRPSADARWHPGRRRALAARSRALPAGVNVLVKGSRSMRLERVVGRAEAAGARGGATH